MSIILSSIIGKNAKHNRWYLGGLEHRIIGKIRSILCLSLTGSQRVRKHYSVSSETGTMRVTTAKSARVAEARRERVSLGSTERESLFRKGEAEVSCMRAMFFLRREACAVSDMYKEDGCKRRHHLVMLQQNKFCCWRRGVECDGMEFT